MNRVLPYVRSMAGVVCLTFGGQALLGQSLIRQGNVLDANMQMGSGGLNRPVPTPNVNMGNRIVSGNVTAGQSFRGYSPVGDPSSLFQIGRPNTAGLGLSSVSGSSLLGGGYSSLPSERIYEFNRDSYNYYEAQSQTEGLTGSALPNAPRPYYSPYSTTTDVNSILSGGQRPGGTLMRGYTPGGTGGGSAGSADPLSGYDPYLSAGSMLQVPTYMVRSDTGQPLTGRVDPRLMQSSLFGSGTFREVPVPTVAADAQRSRYLATPHSGTPLDPRVNTTEPLDRRVDLRTGQPLSSGQAGRSRGGSMLGQPKPEQKADLPQQPISPDDSDAGSRFDSDSTVGGELEVSPRHSSGMRRSADGTLVRPVAGGTGREDRQAGRQAGSLARPLRDEPAAATGAPTGSLEPASTGVIPAPQILAAMGEWPNEPLKTFVSGEQTQFNKYMAEAERMLRSGQYYKAADQYNLARGLDIRNPTPLVGRAMALLAAGDYMTSANCLFQAVRLMESPILFAVDLKAFIPDLATLDRRRADLERRLEQGEVLRLRFLLGYAEYCSGLRKLGLANMEKAAVAAPAELGVIKTFIEMLKTRDVELAKPIQPDAAPPAPSSK